MAYDWHMMHMMVYFQNDIDGKIINQTVVRDRGPGTLSLTTIYIDG